MADPQVSHGSGPHKIVTARRAAALTVIAALAVFAVVQDRVTAHGAERYVELQRAAATTRVSGQGLQTIDEVMRPAVKRSVEQGLLWGGLTAVAGFSVAFLRGKSKGRT